MTTEATSAGIAAIVSGLIGVGTIAANVLISSRKLRESRHERHAQFVSRLYDIRLAEYPKAYYATEGLRRKSLEQMTATSELLASLQALDEWHRSLGGLVLSKSSLNALRALKDLISKAQAQVQLDQAVRNSIWHAKNDFRSALRKDLGLMYVED